jgi:hypothetical protein
MVVLRKLMLVLVVRFPERTNQNEGYAKILPKWSYTAPFPKALHKQKHGLLRAFMSFIVHVLRHRIPRFKTPPIKNCGLKRKSKETK